MGLKANVVPAVDEVVVDVAAAARSLHGGRFRRALEGQAVVDGSWVLAQRPDGTTNREMMIGATLVQWPAWVLGTAVGALLVPSADLLYQFGLDVVFPAFFLLLLLEAVRSRPDHRWVALIAAVLLVLRELYRREFRSVVREALAGSG